MISKTILVGRLTKDPDISFTPSGTQIAKFTLVTENRYTDKAGEKKKDPAFHRITCFDKLASIVEKYVKKGSLLYLEGRIQYGSYEKDGVTRYTCDIIASQMQMLGSRGDSAPVSAPQQPNGGNDESIPF